MSRRQLFPAFRDGWILHQDAHVVVVDKPSGVPSTATDAPVREDLAHRVAQHLEETGRGVGGLAVHHHLDRDASGVVVLGTSREAHLVLGKQVERGESRRTFVVGVTGQVVSGERRVDSDRLGRRSAGRKSRAQGGARLAIEPISRGAVGALAHVTVLEGRESALRPAMRTLGAAIAGDSVREAALAPRLMAHAERTGGDNLFSTRRRRGGRTSRHRHRCLWRARRGARV